MKMKVKGNAIEDDIMSWEILRQAETIYQKSTGKLSSVILSQKEG